jgi:hypothetical protein
MGESRVLRYLKTLSLVKRMLMDAVRVIEAEESELISEVVRGFERPSEPRAPTRAAEYSMPASEVVLSVMEPGKAYTARDIKRLISERHGVDIPISTIYSTLRRLVNRRRVKRVKRGVYQLAH